MLIQSALCDVKKDGNCISPVFVFSNKHVQIGTGSLRIYPTSVCLGSRRKTARKMQSARSGIFFSSSSFRGKFTRCVIISYSDMRFIFGLLIDSRV
jgi:hypothetical protein